MIKEVRYILFPKESIIAAVAEWQRSSGAPLAAASVAHLAVVKEKGCITLVVKFEGDIDESEFIFDENQILQMLLLYCKRNRIPLAARAEKRLEVQNDHIALLSMINIRTASMAVTECSIRYVDEDAEALRKYIKNTEKGKARETQVSRRGAP